MKVISLIKCNAFQGQKNFLKITVVKTLGTSAKEQVVEWLKLSQP